MLQARLKTCAADGVARSRCEDEPGSGARRKKVTVLVTLLLPALGCHFYLITSNYAIFVCMDIQWLIVVKPPCKLGSFREKSEELNASVQTVATTMIARDRKDRQKAAF